MARFRLELGPVPLHHQVYLHLKAALDSGEIAPGDRLPPERELCERFGVSRVAVREALRMLESSGLVEIRVGARGGAFVTAPTSDRVGEGLADLLSMAVVSAADITEARMILEIGMVPLVCERATEEDLADLDALCERARAALSSGTYTMAMSAEFHIRVAQATHNPAVAILVESIRGSILRSMLQAQAGAPEMAPMGAGEHALFVDAVRRRDPEAAAAILRKHLDRTADRVVRH